MNSPAQAGSIDPQAYGDYLRTTPGRLRVDLAWGNLRRFLPSGHDSTLLDVGGGTGEMAVRLAALGFRVTVLDASEAMLAETERAASQANVRGCITLVHGDVAELTRRFRPASFTAIVCHNLLEFVDCSAEVLRAIASLLQPSDRSVASVIVRNRAGEVLSAALKNGDLVGAETNLTAPKVNAKLIGQPVSVFTPQELREMLASAGLNTIAEYGIRVFSDYLSENSGDDSADYAALLALEHKLGTQPDFAAIARYTQMIARPRSGGNSAPGPAR